MYTIGYNKYYSLTPLLNHRAPPIGLGCVTFGRKIDEPASFALLDHAYEHEIRHFDTAEAYGAGVSEQILGRWLSSRRPAGIVIATKAVPPYAPAALETLIEQSLRRLGRRTVDCFYLHRWDETLGDDTLDVLDRACRQGRMRRLGISNLTPVALAGTLARQQARALSRFSTLQCNQNYAVSEMDQTMTNVVNTHGMEVVTFSPLGAGFLTGEHRGGVVPGSCFDMVPGHQAIYFQPAAQRRLAPTRSCRGPRACAGAPRAGLGTAPAPHCDGAGRRPHHRAS